MDLGACMWECHGLSPQGLARPQLLAHWMVIFQNNSFPKRGLFSQRSLFEHAGMPWPWQNAHWGCFGLCCLPIDDALALAVFLSHSGLTHGYCLELSCVTFPWLLPHKGCHGLGSMHMDRPWTQQCVHGGYLALGYWPIGVLLFQIGFFFFSKEVIWASQHALAQAAYQWGLP